MHHHEAQCLLCDAPIAVFDRYLPEHTVAMPAPGRLVLGPSGFLHQQGQGGLLPPPGFEFLPDSTRARDECDEIDLVLETYTQSTATIGLAIRDDATHPLQTQGQTLLNGYGGFHTIAAVAIAHTDTQRYASIPTHPETEEHLFEIVPPVFAMPVSRPGGSQCLRFVLIRAIEHNRCGVLMQPRRRDAIDLQCFEGKSAKDAVEIGAKQRIEDVPQPVIME